MNQELIDRCADLQTPPQERARLRAHLALTLSLEGRGEFYAQIAIAQNRQRRELAEAHPQKGPYAKNR